jgi:hypothetical protein
MTSAALIAHCGHPSSLQKLKKHQHDAITIIITRFGVTITMLCQVFIAASERFPLLLLLCGAFWHEIICDSFAGKEEAVPSVFSRRQHTVFPSDTDGHVPDVIWETGFRWQPDSLCPVVHKD